MCDQTTNTTGQIKGGKVKAYAVTTPKRVPSLPDLPTMQESGLANFDVSIWHGLYAPKGTPKPVIDKLSQALQTALKDPKVKDAFRRARHRARREREGDSRRAGQAGEVADRPVDRRSSRRPASTPTERASQASSRRQVSTMPRAPRGACHDASTADSRHGDDLAAARHERQRLPLPRRDAGILQDRLERTSRAVRRRPGSARPAGASGRAARRPADALRIDAVAFALARSQDSHAAGRRRMPPSHAMS